MKNITSFDFIHQHVKKRYWLERPAEELKVDTRLHLKTLESVTFQKTLQKRKRSDVAYIVGSKGQAFGGFIHNVYGKRYVFPVPDPTLLYFHSAWINLRVIEQYKRALLAKLEVESLKMSEELMNESFNFYNVSFSYTIFLFMASESFINQRIGEAPKGFTYTKGTGPKAVVFNRKEIQERLDFISKLKHVLPLVMNGKKFFNATRGSRLFHLKEFRDEVTHTKLENHALRYQELLAAALDFKYEETLQEVGEFMNFYKPDYLIPCDCGKTD